MTKIPEKFENPFDVLSNEEEPDNPEDIVKCKVSNYVLNTIQEVNFYNDAGFEDYYCTDLLKHMSHGLSFESFAAVINKSTHVLRQWIKDIPEFARAKELGESKNRLFWELLFTLQAKGTVKGNVTATILKLKNLLPNEYKDNTEVHHSGQVQWVLDSGIRRRGDTDHDKWLERDDQNKDAIEAQFKEVTGPNE